MNKPFWICTARSKMTTGQLSPFIWMRAQMKLLFFVSIVRGGWLGHGIRKRLCALQRVALRHSLFSTPRLGDTSHTINDLIPRYPAEAKSHDTRSPIYKQPGSIPSHGQHIKHRRIHYYNIYFEIRRQNAIMHFTIEYIFLLIKMNNPNLLKPVHEMVHPQSSGIELEWFYDYLNKCIAICTYVALDSGRIKEQFKLLLIIK